jgi:hypothetical protein
VYLRLITPADALSQTSGWGQDEERGYHGGLQVYSDCTDYSSSGHRLRSSARGQEHHEQPCHQCTCGLSNLTGQDREERESSTAAFATSGHYQTAGLQFKRAQATRQATSSEHRLHFKRAGVRDRLCGSRGLQYWGQAAQARRSPDRIEEAGCGHWAALDTGTRCALVARHLPGPAASCMPCSPFCIPADHQAHCCGPVPPAGPAGPVRHSACLRAILEALREQRCAWSARWCDAISAAVLLRWTASAAAAICASSSLPCRQSNRCGQTIGPPLAAMPPPDARHSTRHAVR